MGRRGGVGRRGDEGEEGEEVGWWLGSHGGVHENIEEYDRGREEE